MSKEAMKQALEALKGFQHGCTYDGLLRAGEGAIKALEEAWAQPAHALACLPY